jgi:hypothetical protein
MYDFSPIAFSATSIKSNGKNNFLGNEPLIAAQEKIN